MWQKDPNTRPSDQVQDLGSSRPLEVLCGQSPVGVADLGKPVGDPVKLQKVPGSVSVPVIQVICGLVIIGVSFVFINQKAFIAVIPALVGLGFFFVGVNRLKERDRRVRRVQHHQRGFSLQVGDETIGIPYELIETASLQEANVRANRLTIGVLHKLTLSWQNGIYTLSSFEPQGLQIRETDRFVLWARKLIEMKVLPND